MPLELANGDKCKVKVQGAKAGASAAVIEILQIIMLMPIVI
jgi:hypothetical protein